MENMGVPDDIRAVERPKNTVVEQRINKNGVRYIVRERKGCTYKNGRSRPMNGAVIGHIIDHRFVDSRTREPPAFEMQTWALEKVLINLSPDILNKLRSYFDEDVAQSLYSIAILRVENPNIKYSRIKRVFLESSLSETYTKATLFDESIASLLKYVGGSHVGMSKYMATCVDELDKNDTVVVEGMLIGDNGTIYNISYISETLIHNWKTTNLIYAFNMRNTEPIAFYVDNDMPDYKTYGDFIERNDLKNVILLGDKAQSYNVAKNDFNKKPELGYLYPLKRNDKAFDRFSLYEYDGHLETSKISYKVVHDDVMNIWYYSFHDPLLASNEEQIHLDNLRKMNRPLNSEEYKEERKSFGTIAYISNRYLTAEDAYSIYKKRWNLEVMFRIYQDMLEPDSDESQTRSSIEASTFISCISTALTSRLVIHLQQKGVLDEYSYEEVHGMLTKNLRFKGKDGRWNYRKLSEDERILFGKLDILPVEHT